MINQRMSIRGRFFGLYKPRRLSSTKTKNKERALNKCRIIFIICALVILSHEALAQQLIGDWTLALYADGSGEAFTRNTSGSLFGIYCASKCFFYLKENRECVDGERYPVLINYQGGSDYLQMACAKLGTNRTFPVYILGSMDKLIAATSRSRQIGFAMPLQDGEFAVSRFSLNGSNRAISTLVNSVHYGKPASQRQPGDSVM